jgi:ATP synthase F1 epsilon subunit
MVLENEEALHCVVVSPQGKLLDCMASSIIFPAFDGQAGVLKNHIPMLCRLGLGIMEIKSYVPQRQSIAGEFILIDSGFAMVAANEFSITAYEAVSFKDMPADKIEHILEKARKKFQSGTYPPLQRVNEKTKLDLLAKLAAISTATADK